MRDTHVDTVLVSVLYKGDEAYICMYKPDLLSEVLLRLGMWASNPQLSFTWYDAARLSQIMRGRVDEKKEGRKEVGSQKTRPA